MKLSLLFVLITITQMAVALPPPMMLSRVRTVIGNLASYSVTTTNVETGVTYTPQICDNLQAANWVDFPGTPALINGDTEWEYMRMIDTENTTTKPKRFARMKLTYVDN